MSKFIWIKINFDKIILAILIITYIVVLSRLSVLRHDSFSSYFDLSNMDHTVWSILHGHFFSFRLYDDYISRFAIHSDLILVLLSPLFLLWNNIRILIISESVFLGLGAIPLYFLALKVLKNKIISLAIVLVYLLNPGMQWTDIYDFHGVSLSILFLLSSFYFAFIRRWKPYAVFIFLAILTKEEISLDVAMIGLYVFFIIKQRKIGLLTVLASLSWFMLMVYAVIPYFSSQGKHWALDMFGLAPQISVPNLSSINIFPYIQKLFSNDSLLYYNTLLKPFGYFPLLGLPWLLLSFPEIAINTLSVTGLPMRTIHFHYDSGITPFLAIATILAFRYIILFFDKFIRREKLKQYGLYGFCIILVAIAFRVNYHYSPLPTTPSCWCQIYKVTDEDKAFEKALQNLPPKASVSASIEVRSHVNHREEIYFVPSATPSAQYIALITENRLIGNIEPKEYENKLIPILLKDPNHHLLFKSEHFYLFEKK